MKNIAFLFILFFSLVGCNSSSNAIHNKTLKGTSVLYSIPFGVNTWVEDNPNATDHLIDIKNKKLTKWESSKDKLAFYFYSDTQGSLNLSLIGDFPKEGKISISYNGKTRHIPLANKNNKQLAIGEFNIIHTGYQKIIFEQSELLVDAHIYIDKVQVSAESKINKLNFITDKEVYFARRGPSAHLKYSLPKNKKNWQWFYNEVYVPKGFDPVGSYFMANGFGQGYFGIQVNSPTERRVLFSVWSPFKTQDPTKVPNDQRIKLIRKGAGVTTGKFGNEGVGGQSYMKYNWQAGTTYKFLLKVSPQTNNSTEYTAYFYAPELNKWNIIASFQRPNTNTFVENAHSFIENFIPTAGNKVRKALYGNQWVADENGKWYEISDAQFTYDNTARNKYRFDYQGGNENNSFYLKNGGFFNGPTPYKAPLSNQRTNIAPDIDFDSLP